MSLWTLAAGTCLGLLITAAFGCLTWRRTLARRALIGSLAAFLLLVALTYGIQTVGPPGSAASMATLWQP
jgi:hypothetical protein